MGTDTREASCEERIGKNLESRLEDLRLLVKAYREPESVSKEERDALASLGVEGGDIEEAAYTALSEMPLSVETRRVLVVQLSWGGPEDLFEFDLDESDIITGTRYRFKDWFDGAVCDVQDDAAEEAASIAWLIT